MGGNEALEFLASSQTFPDLILLDVMMPDMSGYEVCKEIRRIHNAPIPIIMVSAKGNPEDIAMGLEMGANDYVKKPFHRQEVRRGRGLKRCKWLILCPSIITAPEQSQSHHQDKQHDEELQLFQLDAIQRQPVQ